MHSYISPLLATQICIGSSSKEEENDGYILKLWETCGMDDGVMEEKKQTNRGWLPFSSLFLNFQKTKQKRKIKIWL